MLNLRSNGIFSVRYIVAQFDGEMLLERKFYENYLENSKKSAIFARKFKRRTKS